MNYKGISKHTRVKDLFKIFIFIGFVLASTRIENVHSQDKDYCDKPIRINNELPLSEQSIEGHKLWNYYEKQKLSSARMDDTPGFHSSTYSILFHIILMTRYKAINSNINFYSEIISFIHKSNIWHKSSQKEPVLHSFLYCKELNYSIL